MKRLKKWKKVIILLAVIGSLVVARIVLFESVSVHLYRGYIPTVEKYEKNYIYKKRVIREWGFLKKKC